jgi:hypothetical protein
MFEVTNQKKTNIYIWDFYSENLIHTDRESLLIIEFRSFVFRDRLLFLRCPTDEEFIVSFLPLCRLTISPITRRSECREKAIRLCFDIYQTFVNTFIKQKKKGQ